MRNGVATKLLLTALMFGPLAAMGLLSLSPSKGLDFFVRPATASLKWWAALYSDPSWGQAALTSITVAALSTAVAAFAVTPVVLVWRLSGARLSAVLLAVSSLGFFVPPIVLAVGLYQIMLAAGLFDTVLGLSIAHLSITAPVIAFVLTQRLRGADDASYLVARALGADPIAAAITWLAADHKHSLVAALAAAFMGSMSEATLTFFLTDTHVLTIAKRVLSGISQELDPSSYAAMVTWIVIVLVGSIFVPLFSEPQETDQ